MKLDPAEAARIESAFDAAQTKTRAPVVGVLASASLASEAEFLLGAAVLALATPLPLLLFTEMSAQRIYISQLLVAILAAVVGSLPWSRRLLAPKRAQRAACHRAALAQFVLRGLDRSQCGVMVYVSLAEHYIRIVPAEDASSGVGHHFNPSTLLVYSRYLFHKEPPAWLITVPGRDFDHGEGLSETALESIRSAPEILSALIPLLPVS